MEKIIELKKFIKNFGDNQVLKGIDLNIYENEFLTLLEVSGWLEKQQYLQKIIAIRRTRIMVR